MSIKQCCSLCCTSCDEYKLLQNELGDSNEVYEITVKYFDPMLLTGEGHPIYDQEFKVLCQNCWYHIKDFHEFQQTVIMSRNSLEKSLCSNQLEIEVKQENIIGDDNESDKGHKEDEDDDGLDKSDMNDHNFEDFYVNNYKKETDYLLDDYMEDDSDENDEKPLISLTKTGKNSLNSNSNELVNEQNPVEEKTKSRNRRKPKNSIRNDLKTEDNKEKPPTKRKKIINKKNTSNNLEKGIESDNFIAEWKPELECDMCGEFSKNFHQLSQHFKEKHTTRCYFKCCKRKFYRRSELVDHIRLHLNPEMHKCDICGKPCSSQNYLKLHKNIIHGNTKKFECEVCHKMFNQKPTLERHMLTHVTGSKDFVCQECGKGYVLEVQLKSHIKSVHNVDRVCDQCGKTIHGIAALKKHLMEHAGIQKPKFACEICGSELNTRNSLRRHIAAFHHDGSTIYVCGICGKVAASENALIRHKRMVHEVERKHKCTYCDKAFKRPKVLREHIATHTGQDLYQCPHCPQTFKVSANMHHHRKKVHPIEWEEGRKNRLQLPKINIDQIKNQVVI